MNGISFSFGRMRHPLCLCSFRQITDCTAAAAASAAAAVAASRRRSPPVALDPCMSAQRTRPRHAATGHYAAALARVVTALDLSRTTLESFAALVDAFIRRYVFHKSWALIISAHAPLSLPLHYPLASRVARHPPTPYILPGLVFQNARDV